MMKEFCDGCRKEVFRNYISDRFELNYETYSIRMILAYDGTWNGGSICNECLVKLLKECINTLEKKDGK